MDRDPRSEDLVRDLGDEAAYPEPVASVETRATHVSWLFFAGEHVYKVKKPVRFPFLDFSTPELRKHFCEEEVRLNRRLVQGVHLGVVPIVRGADGRHRIGGAGTTVEHAVLMRRLPAERMLDALLERGELDNGLFQRLARLLAAFHRGADAGPEVARHGSPEAVRRNVEDNLKELGPYVEGAASPGLAALSPALHGFLTARARAFLDGHGELLARRVRAGRVRDGHGDLHAENVCALADGTFAIYDCIEFNPALRAGDVACDLAFLLMDLEQRGYPGFAGYLSHRYAEEAGDPELGGLVPFYKGYRACVRAKVALLGAGAGAGGKGSGAGVATAVARAARYLHLAAGYELPPPLILIEGDEARARGLATVLQRPFRARILDAGGASLGDVARTLAHEEVALIALSFGEQGLELALADAGVRMGRRLVRLDVAEWTGSPEVVVGGVIERLLSR
jgi:uncharacterized protein